MSLQADKWIRKMALEEGMIEPFVDSQVKSIENHKIVSYGLSSYGYDVRVGNRFKVFTNVHNSIVDPKISQRMLLLISKGPLYYSTEFFCFSLHYRVFPHP